MSSDQHLARGVGVTTDRLELEPPSSGGLHFTSAQRDAIAATGNVLVMAGAGTGKTRTLVTRCLRLLLDPAAELSLDEILMVTFTEAAAAEMRKRIREELEQALARQPDNPRLAEQLALLDTAHISTLHSFCLELVRQNFYALELDPQVAVLAEEQSRLLAEEVLDELLADHYAGRTPDAAAVQELIQSQARGWDVPIRELVRQIHEHTQTRPDPEGWFRRELDKFDHAEPLQWRQWLVEGFCAWRDHWLPVLDAAPPENVNAHRCAEALASVSKKVRGNTPDDVTDVPVTGTDVLRPIADVLKRVLDQNASWPKGKTKAFRDPIRKLFDEAAFLRSLAEVHKDADPLAEDWQWVRGHMATLLRLAREFSRRFREAKREHGAVDFHDLEQGALQLLWDFERHQPTALARQWRDKFKQVFVDEYQDINEAQDKILTALSRDHDRANRFLVGDVKQSIYRFRQASPRIFRHYAEQWRAGADGGRTIDLADNFRSHESLLRFVNALFTGLMCREVGGVAYDAAAQLKFGQPSERVALSLASDPVPRVEVHLRLLIKEDEDRNAEADADLSNAEKEARLVGWRLQALHDARHQVWDDQLKTRRGVQWSDMVVLLRSPATKVEGYAKEFARLGVPLQAKRTGFYDSSEVLDLLSLLQLLDNPLQDVPAIAVLRSPLVGLSLDELAEIRLAARKVRFWTALERWHESQRSKVKGQRSELEGAGTWLTVDTFLTRFARWRAMAREASLTQRLELVLDETHYLDWLLTQPRGEQRQANVQQLLAVAREFDELRQQGLYRFLQFIEAQKEIAGDREPAPLETQDAVRLMSIHQSKGLEFPVVVVADLGKPFNFSDAKGTLILDEQYGLCPQVTPPDTGQHYPSLPFWLARRRQRAEALGEELRVLYVALTRAQDTLILTGTCSARTAEGWLENASDTPHQLLQANHYLDWLGPRLTHLAGTRDWLEQEQGENGLWRWRIVRELVQPETAPATEPLGLDATPVIAEKFSALVERLQWKYPYLPAIHEPAKTTVTALRRRVAEESDAESRLAPFLTVKAKTAPDPTKRELSGAQRGSVHHRFLQFLPLDQAGSLEGLRTEAQRLEQAKLLLPEEAKALDLEAIAVFWQSDVGLKIRSQAEHVQRELPFTLRLTRDDLKGDPLADTIPEGEFIVVQGVVDLAVLRPQEIWLLDFKTDDVAPCDLAEKIGLYQPQLKLYALALERIFLRPVTVRWLHFLALRRTVAV